MIFSYLFILFYFVQSTSVEVHNSQELADAIANIQSGDTILCHGGVYEVSNLVIKDVSDVTVKAFNTNDKVTFDATVPVTSTWTALNSGSKIYKASVDPLWQLFVDGEEVGVARFPNAKADSENRWNRFAWRTSDIKRVSYPKGQTTRTMYDTEKNCEGSNQKLSGQPSLENCMAILNIGHWETAARKITSHSAGDDYFTWEEAGPGRDGFTIYNELDFTPHKDGFYFVECLAALDAPGEWGYDVSTNEAYVWLANSGNPNNHKIRAKTADTILYVFRGTNVVVEDITFFGGGLVYQDMTNSAVNSVTFEYASASKRVLGSANRAPSALLFTKTGQIGKPSGNTVFDCEFIETDGPALELEGQTQTTVTNNYFKNIDYSAAYAHGAIDWGSSSVTEFSWNYVDTTGSSETTRTGSLSTVKYNYFRNGGLLQEDGAAVQVRRNVQEGSKLYRNWAMDTGKIGFRFDTPVGNSLMGKKGEMRENVAFNCRRGLAIKGEEHIVEYNTALMNTWNGKNDIIVYVDNIGNSANGIYNTQTKTNGNLADKLSGDTEYDMDLHDTSGLGLAQDNWNGYEVNKGVASGQEQHLLNLLVDASNGDFRPKSSSTTVKDYGAYRFVADENGFLPYYEENGAKIWLKYWIPGRKSLNKASMPQPPTNQEDVSPSSVELKWLECLSCSKQTTYKIYFGTQSGSLVEIATVDNGSNILPLSTLISNSNYQRKDMTITASNKANLVGFSLVAGESYYWRVDVGNVVGDEWKFTLGSGQAYSTVCPNLNDVLAELEKFKKSVTTGFGSVKTVCTSTKVETFWNTEANIFKNYEACKSWQCGRRAMKDANKCELEAIATTKYGKKHYGRLAAHLSSEFCFQDEGNKCYLAEQCNSGNCHIGMTQPSQNYEEPCEFGAVWRDFRSLEGSMSNKKGYQNHLWYENSKNGVYKTNCDDNDRLRTWLDNTMVIQNQKCSQIALNTVTLSLRSPYFTNDIATGIYGCYNIQFGTSDVTMSSVQQALKFCDTYKCTNGLSQIEAAKGTSCPYQACTSNLCCTVRDRCDTFTCPQTHLDRSNAANIKCVGSPCTVTDDLDKCCRERASCSSYACPVNFVAKSTAGLCAGEKCFAIDKLTCCEPQDDCSNYESTVSSCPTGSALISNPKTVKCDGASCTQASDESKCCEQRDNCGSWNNCPWKFVLRPNAQSILCSTQSCTQANDLNTCCEAKDTCKNMVCETGYRSKNGVANILCEGSTCDFNSAYDRSKCCVALAQCSSFDCGKYKQFKQNVQNNNEFCKAPTCFLSDASKCCLTRETCKQGKICPNDHVSIGQNDWEYCEDEKCDFNNPKDASLCCAPRATCSTYDCKAAWDGLVTKVGADNVLCDGVTCFWKDRLKCCDERQTCKAGKICPSDYVSRPNSDQARCVGGLCDANIPEDLNKCCIPKAKCGDTDFCSTIESYLIPRAGNENELCKSSVCGQNDRGKCCAPRQTCKQGNICPSGSHLKKPNSDDVRCDDVSCTLAADVDKCCTPRAQCESMTCESHWNIYLNKVSANKEYCQGNQCTWKDDKNKCCVEKAKCTSHTCPSDSVLVPNAPWKHCDGLVCDSSSTFDNQECCESKATCSSWDCNADYMNYVNDPVKANEFCEGSTCVATIANRITCCVIRQTCNDFDCAAAQTGYKNKNAAGVRCEGAICNFADDSDKCCYAQAKCSSYQCSNDVSFVQNHDNDDEFCNFGTCFPKDRPTCCKERATCSSSSCPTGYKSKSGVANNRCVGDVCDFENVAEDLNECCEERASCSSWTCPGIWTNKANDDSILCVGNTCNFASDKLTCCDQKQTCAGYQCPSGFNRVNNPQFKRCAGKDCEASDYSTCCIPSTIIGLKSCNDWSAQEKQAAKKIARDEINAFGETFHRFDLTCRGKADSIPIQMNEQFKSCSSGEVSKFQNLMNSIIAEVESELDYITGVVLTCNQSSSGRRLLDMHV